MPMSGPTSRITVSSCDFAAAARAAARTCSKLNAPRAGSRGAPRAPVATLERRQATVSFRPSVQPPLSDEADGLLGHEELERAPRGRPLAQLGARQLEARDLDRRDAEPGELAGGALQARARPVDDGEGDETAHLVEPLPGTEHGGHVGADEEEQLGPGVTTGQLGGRVGGVGGPAPLDLDRARLEALHARDGSLDEREAVQRRRDGAPTHLLPRLVRDDEQDAVEAQV